MSGEYQVQRRVSAMGSIVGHEVREVMGMRASLHGPCR